MNLICSNLVWSIQLVFLTTLSIVHLLYLNFYSNILDKTNYTFCWTYNLQTPDSSYCGEALQSPDQSTFMCVLQEAQVLWTDFRRRFQKPSKLFRGLASKCGSWPETNRRRPSTSPTPASFSAPVTSCWQPTVITRSEQVDLSFSHVWWCRCIGENLTLCISMMSFQWSINQFYRKIQNICINSDWMRHLRESTQTRMMSCFNFITKQNPGKPSQNQRGVFCCVRCFMKMCVDPWSCRKHVKLYSTSSLWRSNVEKKV